MAILPTATLLMIIVFVYLVFFTIFKGRIRWLMLTTFSIVLATVLLGLYSYFTNVTFRREFAVWFQPSSQYTDWDTNADLPLPAYTAFDYRYSENTVVFFTNQTPPEVHSFYQNIKGLTIQEGQSPSPGMSQYNVTYKGKKLRVTIIPQDRSLGCQIMISPNPFS